MLKLMTLVREFDSNLLARKYIELYEQMLTKHLFVQFLSLIHI